MLLTRHQFIATMFLLALSGCGLGVPSKTFRSDAPDASTHLSEQGTYENVIVSHLVCEIANGIGAANTSFDLPWLVSKTWGTAVTLTITAEDQSGLSPGLSFIRPLPNVISTFPVGGNVTSSQSFTLGVGGSGSVNATRTETIQFTFVNSALLAFSKNYPSDCSDYSTGITIDGDLRIREFIYDKALIARLGNASLYVGKSTKDAAIAWKYPIYNTFTDTLNFVSILGANVTPSWKLAHFSDNPSSNFITAQRTYTNQVIITIGPIGTQPSATQPAALSQSAQNQHNAQVQAGATATSIQGASQ
jgi:hypothetical protein